MSGTPRILLVEDDRNTLSGLTEILSQEGYEVSGVNSAEKALRLLGQQQYHVLLTDLKMEGMDGLALYDRVHELDPDLKAILMTAYSSVKDAVEAMKKGVYEYLTKPLDLDELFVILRKAVNERALQLENLELKSRIRDTFRFQNMIGSSEAMRAVYGRITKVARSQATVLIRGESGVGKELVARAIHYNSPRGEGPLVEISCASFPETLLESELFGYEKGAFTGADGLKRGRFEVAHGGTLFMDEVGEISEGVQTKLLHAMQEKEVSRLGSTQSIRIDVRVIAATNRDLEAALQSGRFREDLYYRLNVIPIYVPPLRERKEDVPALIEHFLQKYGEENERRDLRFSDAALEMCMQYDWPGNVRELENAIENAVVLGDGDTVLPEHLPFSIYTRVATPTSPAGPQLLGETFRQKMDYAERIVLQQAIEKADGNKSEAAKALKISLRNMRYKIKKYGL